MAAARWVEKPPHVDPERMECSDEALLDAIHPESPVSVRLSGATSPDPLVTWCRNRPDPVGDFGGRAWGDVRARPPDDDEVLVAADGLLDRVVGWTDPRYGRSGLYGLHNLRFTLPLLEAFHISDHDRYPERWVELFEEWLASRDDVQGEWPGLDVIWYTLGVGERCQLILRAEQVLRSWEGLSVQTWTALVRTIVGGGRWLYEEHDAFRPGNWQVAGCGSLLQIAAAFPELTESRQWAARARDRLLEHLEWDFHTDGGHYERSPGYHAYCLTAYRSAALIGPDLLQWDVTVHPRFAAMYEWLAALAGPGGWMPPWNDGGVVWAGPELVWGHYFCLRPEWKWLVEKWMTPGAIHELVATLPYRDGRHPVTRFSTSSASPPPDRGRLLEQSGMAVVRSGWGKQSLFAAINAGSWVGHELESHSHHAVVDVMLAGWGRLLVGEAGGPASYDGPEYHDWYQATVAHSTVLPDGYELARDRSVEVLLFVDLGGIGVVQIRHLGYPGLAHTRTLLAVQPSDLGPPYWLIHDRVDPGVPHCWILHGYAPWAEVEQGVLHSGTAPGVVVALADASPWTETRGPAQRPDPVEAGTEACTIYGLRVHRETSETTAFVVPFEQEPPLVNVSQHPGLVTADLEGCRDRFGPGWWYRVGSTGWAAAGLGSDDAAATDPGAVGPPLSVRGESLTAWYAKGRPGTVEITLRVTRPCDVVVRVAGAETARLGNVDVPVADEAFRVRCPAPDNWKLTVGLGDDQ